MTRPTLQEDINWVIKEIKEELGNVFRFYRSQSAESNAARKFNYQVKVLEIGPIGWLKFIVGLLISIVVVVAFSVGQLHFGWIIIIGIFFLIMDRILEWGIIAPQAGKILGFIDGIIRGIGDRVQKATGYVKKDE